MRRLLVTGALAVGALVAAPAPSQALALRPCAQGAVITTTYPQAPRCNLNGSQRWDTRIPRWVARPRALCNWMGGAYRPALRLCRDRDY